MMNIIRYPKREEWGDIVKRPNIDVAKLNTVVSAVLQDIRQNGDAAVKKYAEQFDHAVLHSLAVTEKEIDEACRLVTDELKNAIVLAYHNIKAFHEAQCFDSIRIDTQPGVTCWQKSVAIQRVGLYVPGGTAPLFSTVLMLATPARIAGCGEIVLCTPPGHDGRINPAILFAAHISGVHKIFKAGGIQAIGAMAYGTESIPKVYKIFGPGNQYVMAAKQQVCLQDTAIDMPAGPSEVCIIADESADCSFIAADLLSQAEHGTDSQAILITTSERIIDGVQREVEDQLARLPRKDITSRALENSKLILVDSKEEAMELSNTYAPEHLIIQTDNCEEMSEKVINAGSVFLGKFACESAGDYASGTNHTLPTHGHARAYSGVNTDSFCRKITFQSLTAEGIQHIGVAVETMAEAESLDAHKNAMTLRLKALLNNNKQFSQNKTDGNERPKRTHKA